MPLDGTPRDEVARGARRARGKAPEQVRRLGADAGVTNATPATDGAPSVAVSVVTLRSSDDLPRDRYGTDVPEHRLARPRSAPRRQAPAELGAVVEEVTTDWCGEIVAVDRDPRW